ncbi:MAG: helix-turn-helix domain-containing protein [Rhodospirillales bacterium]
MDAMLPSLLPSLRFDTRLLPQAARWDVYRGGMGVAFDVAVHREAGPEFMVAAEMRMLGQMLVNSRRTTAQQIIRPAQRTRRDGIDHYLLSLLHSGTLIADADGTVVRAPPGAVVLLDLARPIEAAVSANSSVSFTVPRDTLDALLPAGSLWHGMTVPGSAGLLLADYLAALEHRVPQLSPAEAPFIERATHDMIAACIAPSRARLEQAGVQVAGSLRLEAKRVVDARLHEPNLAPEDVAAAVGISRATLYRLFERDGGVAAFIRERRLRQAGRLLADPAERRRISQIAYACGFENETHFSRAFRREYGATASEVRAVKVWGRETVPVGGHDVVDMFQRWVLDLSA